MSLISVIIPTLNAEASLNDTVKCIVMDNPRHAVEIVVSDGGSTDGTVANARCAGWLVVEGAPGRGIQLARGAALAGGDWFLFLHADTRLLAGWASEVSTFIERSGANNRAASFTFALDDRSLSARLIEAIVAWRVSVLALPYGDQGLLISRELYHALGGYRPYPLMEDVDLVRRIGRSRIEALKACAMTSAARYRHDGYAVRSMRNVLTLVLYFLGVPPKLLAKYYG